MDESRYNIFKGRLVVLVDDSRAVLTYYEKYLYKFGAKVKAFEDPRECLEVLNELTPDLIVLDFEMPYLSGPDLCLKIKEQDTLENIPVMMLTGKSSDEDIVIAIQSGADDFVNKGLGIEVVLHKMVAQLRQVQMKEALIRLKRVEAANQMSATLNHEFNNLLAILSGRIGLFRKTLPEGRRDRVTPVLDSIKRLTILLKKLSNLNSIETQKYSEDSDYINLDKSSKKDDSAA